MNYKTGDILKASINKIPLVYHYGIILEKNGEIKIIHNSPNEKNNYEGNILVNSLQEFVETRKIVNVQRTNITREKIIMAIDKYKSLPFGLFTFNCEHFIFEIRDGRSHSPQLINAFKILVTILMIAYSIKNRLLIRKTNNNISTIKL